MDRWPGSIHDATIFANSAIRAKLENGEFEGSVIIGKCIFGIQMNLEG